LIFASDEDNGARMMAEAGGQRNYRVYFATGLPFMTRLL
jgi:hypothetical protein